MKEEGVLHATIQVVLSAVLDLQRLHFSQIITSSDKNHNNNNKEKKNETACSVCV